MYAKVFAQMYDGTLRTRAPWQALVTFQQLLILADQEGTVDMTLDTIHLRTGIPFEILEMGVQALQMEDKASRTPDEDGRRIVLLDEHRDWGWRLVNYTKYRQMQRESDRREYHASRYQAKKLGLLKVGKVLDSAVETVEKAEIQQRQQVPPIPPIAEAYAEAEAVKNTRSKTVPVSDVLAAYHDHFQCGAKVTKLTHARKIAIESRWLEVAKGEYRNPDDPKAGQQRDQESCLRFFIRYFQFCSGLGWLNGKTPSPNYEGKRATIDLLIRASFMAKRVDEALGSPA